MSTTALSRFQKNIKTLGKLHDARKLAAMYRLACNLEPCMAEENIIALSDALMTESTTSLLPQFIKQLLSFQGTLTDFDKINLKVIAKLHIDTILCKAPTYNGRELEQLLRYLKETLMFDYHIAHEEGVSGIVDKVFSYIGILLSVPTACNVRESMNVLKDMSWPKPDFSTCDEVLQMRINCLLQLKKYLMEALDATRDNITQMQHLQNLTLLFQAFFYSRDTDQHIFAADASLAEELCLVEFYEFLLLRAVEQNAPCFLLSLCDYFVGHPYELILSPEVTYTVMEYLYKHYTETKQVEVWTVLLHLCAHACQEGQRYTDVKPVIQTGKNSLTLATWLDKWEIHLLIACFLYEMKETEVLSEASDSLEAYNIELIVGHIAKPDMAKLYTLANMIKKVTDILQDLGIRYIHGKPRTIELIAYDVKSYLSKLSKVTESTQDNELAVLPEPTETADIAESTDTGTFLEAELPEAATETLYDELPESLQTASDATVETEAMPKTTFTDAFPDMKVDITF